MVDFSIQDQVAVVSGGAGGLCSGMCRALAEAGVKVVVLDLRLEPADALAADLGLDQVKLYRLYSATGELHPAQPAFIPVHAAAGPRPG